MRSRLQLEKEHGRSHDYFRFKTINWSLGQRRREIRPERRSGEELQHQFQRYGIVAVQLTVFDWGGYRYTNASDAIAAAKRARADW